MEDNGIHIDENLQNTKEVLRAPGSVMKLVTRDRSLEDETRNTILATQLLSSVYSPNENSGVAGQVSVPTGLSFSKHITVFIGAMNPIINSTLTSNETMLGSPSTWSHEEIVAVIIVSLMVPFILISNISVILSIIRFRRLRTPTNYFIMSLAAVDIFVALATPFGIVVEVFQFIDAAKPQDAMLCLLPNRVLMMACGVSVLTLAAIAYDRHTALVSPLEYVNIMTTRKVAIIISLSWIYSVLIVWLPLMVGWYSVPSYDAPCSANLIQGKAPVLFLSAIFVPSCIAILVCYFRIFLVARHHVKAIAALEFSVHRRLQDKNMLKDTRYAITLALVIGVFLALWLPYLICIFIKTVGSMKLDVWVQTFLILLAVFNSGINPWIYAYKNSELRAAFKRMYRELCRDKSCKTDGRRSSLVSVISTTPRLSLTDNRMISIIPEVTVDTSNDKLRKTFPNFLSEYEAKCASNQSCMYNQAFIEEISSQSLSNYQQQSRRQAASCSDLDDVGDDLMGKTDTLTHSRSFSMDLTLMRDLVESSSDVFPPSDSPLYYEAPVSASSVFFETLNEADIHTKISASLSSLTSNTTPSLRLQARTSLPTYLQQPAVSSRHRRSAESHFRERPSSLLSSRNHSTESAVPLQPYTTIAPTLHLHTSAALLQQHTSPTSLLQNTSATSLQQHTSATSLQQHISATSLQQHTSATSLQQHTPATSLQQHTSATSLQQHTSATSVQQHTSATSLQQHTSATSLQQHTSATSLQQHTPTTSLQQHTSATSLQQHTSATSLQQHTPTTSLQQHTSATSVQQHTSATSLQQEHNFNTHPYFFMNTTMRSDVSSRQSRYSCDDLSSVTCCPYQDLFPGIVDCTHDIDLKLPNSSDPRILSHTKSCPVAKPVTSYYFLLPICETLALDVISRAARLETCLHLATHGTCDNRILVQ